MPLPTQPANLPVWDTNGTNMATPAAGQQASGWTAGQGANSSWMNWWMNLVYLWLLWLQSITQQALTWTGLQTFSAAATFNAGAVAAPATSAVGEAWGVDSGVVVASQNVVAYSGSWGPAITASSGLPAGSTIVLTEDDAAQFRVCLAGRDERVMRGVVHIHFAAATSIPVGAGVQIAGAVIPGGTFHSGPLAAWGTAGTMHIADPITDGGDTGQPFVALVQLNSNGTITAYLLAMQNTGGLNDFYIPYTFVVVGD